ncbi:hypothetical protein Emag_000509 [Eimeria magna]
MRLFVPLQRGAPRGDSCGQGSGLTGPAALRRLSAHAPKSVSAILLLKGVSQPCGLAKDGHLNTHHYRELNNASTGPLMGVAHILHAGRCKRVFISQAPTLPATPATGCLFFSSQIHVSTSFRSSKGPTSNEFEAQQSDSHTSVQTTPGFQHTHPANDAPGDPRTSQFPGGQNSTPTCSLKSENLQHKRKEVASEEPIRAPPEENLRVSLWELLLFIRQEKFRMAAILFALLLSSGAQLLLPVAVGQLVDAVTLSPPLKQQHKRVLMQGDAFGSPQEDDVLTEGQVGVAPAGPCSGQASTVEPRREAVKEAEDILGRRAFLESLGDVFKTPAARVGFCGFLGAVGAATSFMRLYLLESTASQHQKLGALVKHISRIGLCWTIAPLSFLLSLLLPVSVAAFLLRVSGKQVSALQQQHSKALQGALQRATVALGARKQLRSLNAEAYELKAFNSAIVFIVRRVLAAAGILTGGQVMSLALYSAIVGTSLQGCATAWSDTSRALAAAAEMLQQLMRGTPKAFATPYSHEAERHRYQIALGSLQTGAAAETISSDCRGPSVEFKDVWFSYPEREKHWALKGINFTVPPGAKVAILGLIDVAAALFCVQVVPVTQESLLVGEGSLQESILYAQKAHQEITGETGASSPLALNTACDAACVTSFASALPEGLKTPLDEKVAVLSGGQRQRVCLAMALYRLGQSQRSSEETISQGGRGNSDCSEGDLPRLPTVLLLDEATSSLDAATEHQVLHNLKKVMDGGQLIQFGRKEDVLNRACPPLQW